jgi:glutaredoxin
MAMTKVKGSKPTRKITLYALSTCGWCRRTKELLNLRKVEYEYCDVDEMTGKEKTETMAAVEKLNPHRSFPTLRIGDEVVIGFDEARITKLIGP